MALDQPTLDFLATMAAQMPADAPPMWEMEPVQVRQTGAVLRQMFGEGPQMTAVEDHVLRSTDGGAFTVRTLRPTETTEAVVVYFHGGGWVTGHIDEFDTLARKLARRTGFAVALVDYRLAPEYPFPTPLEDAWAAVQWVEQNREVITGSAEARLVVAGDSAGGNLAAVAAQRARDRSGPQIDAQVLVYPVTDADFETDSYLDPENALMLTKESMYWFWDHYAPRGSRENPEVAPLRAADLAGLPPAVVVTAAHDVLRSEGESYAQRLEESGVPVRFRRFEGQMHGFFTMANILPASDEAIEYIATELAALKGVKA